MRTTSEQNEIKWATKLQDVLGSDYYIHYDACESGTTDCYFKGKLYKQVPNSAMCGSLNITEFRAPIEMRTSVFSFC